MDKKLHAQYSVNKIEHQFPTINGTLIEVWEWISNFILHFMMDVKVKPC